MSTPFTSRPAARRSSARNQGVTFPLDLASALRGGEVASALQRAGQGIGFADCLQAGTCIRHGLPLATRNRKHFDRVEGLRLVDLDDS